MMRCLFSLRFPVAIVVALALLLGAVAAPDHSVSAAAALSLSRHVAGPGDRVAVTGSGFHAGDAVTTVAFLRVNGRAQQAQAATAVADRSGSISTAFDVPGGTNPGTYAVTARDSHGTVGRTYVTVLPLVSVHAGSRTGSVTVVGGNEFYVSGAGFGASEVVRVVASFRLYNGDTVSTSASRTTNGAGSFYEATLRVPHNAAGGSASLTATGARTGRRGTAALNVTYHPSINESPGTVAPGGTITVRGAGYVANTRVTASLTIPRTDGSYVTVSKAPYADGNGNIVTTLTVPVTVANGRYSISGVDAAGGYRASTGVTVARRPQPTATATPRPTATATPTATPPPPKKKGLGFRWISLWYHPVHAGTWDFLDIQVKPSHTTGIWVQVIFPSGTHYYYYEQTNSHGHWTKRFTIPRNANSRYSNQAEITVQLWRGGKTVRTFLNFTVV